MSKIVIIISATKDSHADRLEKYLSLKTQVVRLNLDDLFLWDFEIQNQDLTLIYKDNRFPLEKIKSVFLRRAPTFEAFKKNVSDDYTEFSDYIALQKFSLFSDALAILNNSVKFCNNLESAQFQSKNVQIGIALTCGLKIPQTYVGSDPKEAYSFIKKLRDLNLNVCTKSINNKKVIIDGIESTRFTKILSDVKEVDLATLKDCPIIFQEYIDKAYELRSTVIGDHIHTVKIDSQIAGAETAIDWRKYNIARTPHSSYELPNEIREKILEINRKMKLTYSAFDLIRAKNGEYIFVETNPYGQWLWLEDLTGVSITQSISDYLIG